MFIGYEDTTEIGMIQGDFGIVLPIELEGISIAEKDKFTFNIFKKINEKPIISKTFSNISNNIINFQLTEEETKLLEVGYYFYDIDWYQEETFLGNLVAKSPFQVLEKAGNIK